MAESPEDKDVDTLISEMQDTLDKLKAAQGKDVKDESDGGYDYDQPSKAKNLRDATKDAYIRVRAHNRRARQASSEDDEK